MITARWSSPISSGAAQRYPVVALCLSIAVLGLGGLPPLAGFMSKWQIFVAGFVTGRPAIEGLTVFAALMSVLSMAYYVPLVNAMYRRETSEAVAAGKALPIVMVVPLVLLAVAVVAIGVWPALLQWLTAPAGSSPTGRIRGIGDAVHWCFRRELEMTHLLLTPPVAFILYGVFVGILALIARWLVGPVEETAAERKTYASGEAGPQYVAAPGYRQFFIIALFFAIVHIGVLILGSEGRSWTAMIYLMGLFLALVVLILG